jgi:hypothetical protein
MSNTKDAGFVDDEHTSAAPAGPVVEKYYILFIAIDKYKSDAGIKDLRNPVLDATNLLNILRDRYDMGIPPADQAADLRLTNPEDYKGSPIPLLVYNTLQTKCLYNENATKGNINQHLTAVSAAIGPNDALLVFFSGHGTTHDDKGYLLCHNATKDVDEKTGWLPQDEIYAKFNNYTQDKKCRQLLLLLDCCHAGAATLGKQGVNDTGDFGREVVMACGHDRLAADGKPGEGSPFAKAWVAALKANKETTLVFPQIQNAIAAELETQTMGAQHLDYGPLPTNHNGRGKFPLRLKAIGQ